MNVVALPRVTAARPARWSRQQVLLWASPAAALLLWVSSLATTDAQDLPVGGLVPRFPLTYWAGLAVVVVSAVSLTQAPRLRHGHLMANLGVLLAMLYATAPALEDAPRYTYTYKHIAISQYIELYGSVDKTIDIYHRWPGFFSLSAWFSQVSGLPDPTSYAAWAELYFTTLDALVVWAAVHTVSRSTRTAWQACLLFTVTNWVGQDYYSPQAFGYLLMLGILLACLIALRTAPGPFGRGVERLVVKVFRVRAERRDVLPAGVGRAHVARLLGLVVLFDSVLAATHQLTPYVLLLQLTALVLAGYLRPWWVVVVTGVATVGYLIPNYDYVVSTFGLLGSSDPLANATTKNVDGIPLLHVRLITDLALLSLLVCFFGCFGGLVRRARQGLVSDAVLVGALAFSPVLTLGAQNYGGEARLRVFLYALPWLCCGLSWLWSPEGRDRRRWQLLLPTSVTLGLTVCFVAFFLGREDINQLTPQEVGAAAYLFDPAVARPRATVALLAPNFPTRYGPLYFRLAGAEPESLSYTKFPERQLLFPSEQDVAAAAAIMKTESSAGGYLVFTRGQEAWARDYQLYVPHGLQAFEGRVAHSPLFRLVYDQPTARIYELNP